MSVLLRLGGFALASTALFGAAFGIGRAVSPDVTDAAPAPAEVAAPIALVMSDQGYTLHPKASQLPATSAPSPFEFTVTRPDGTTLTAYTPMKGAEMRLVVIRRDLLRYVRLQPTRAADGTWSAPLMLPDPGTYRVFATFQPRGVDKPLALGVDIQAAQGEPQEQLPPPSRAVDADGYQVGVAGWLRSETESRLTFSVTRGGQPVTDLQPLEGMPAQLVALRSGDTAALPIRFESGTVGPDITFRLPVPSPGTYRLFLDFQHGGAVHTVAVTMTAT